MEGVAEQEGRSTVTRKKDKTTGTITIEGKTHPKNNTAFNLFGDLTVFETLQKKKKKKHSNEQNFKCCVNTFSD